MADIWDDSFNWDNPSPATTPATGGGGDSTPAAAASPAAPNIKAQSGVTPDMASWFQGAWNNKDVNWWKGAQNLNDTFNNVFKNGPRYQGQTDQMMGEIPGAWNTYKNLPSLIDQQQNNMINPGLVDTQRQNMINQLYASLPRMRELYQPAMEDMSRRGILNSSITGDALTTIQDKVNQGLLGQTAAANTWAGGQNIDQYNAANKWGADQRVNQATNMPTVLNNIISSILAGNKQGQDFGTAGANVANAQQGLTTDLLKIFGPQTTTYNV